MPLRREPGCVTVCDPGSDKPILEAQTLQCVHCGGHWIPQPGSGRLRGFCMRCNGPICGPDCQECVPVEKLLEIMEGTCDPTAVSVGGGKLWLPGTSLE